MKSFSKNIVVAVLVFFLLAFSFSLLFEQLSEPEEISLSKLIAEIEAGNVEKIKIQGNELEVTVAGGEIRKAKKESEAGLTETLRNYGVSETALQKVEVVVSNPTGFLFWAGALLPFLLPVGIILLFFWFMSRQVSRANVQAFSFGQSKARVISPGSVKDKITFKDVAGVDEAKEELKEVVDFLKNPQKFLNIGARIPKGVLLVGAPGTGKTLLARAVAGEASVPFFHMSASEFVEMFVGVGASRVRDLFNTAKKAAPAIIFIDEIDAVGRHRGAGLGGGHDEREQTLNQILVELDGFEPNESVIVMAASNRPDVLDPALLRPGRFDRRVILDLPDLKAREAILKIHAVGKPLAEGVDMKRVAERTPGFSGADLKNLLNEAAIYAARKNKNIVSQPDILGSIEKVILGPERKSRLFSKKEKEISAFHEAGHALVASALPHADPVHKVSVVSRGRAAGYTLKLPTEDRHLYSRSHFIDELAALLGGYAAEKTVFSELTTGASNDLKQATAVARDMVTKYGMSEKVGPISLGGHENIFLGKEIGHERHYSEEIAALVDREVSGFLKDALKTALSTVKKHKKALKAVADKLIEKESIERNEFEDIMKSFGALSGKTA